jgi:signal transduction histidine kinase
VTDDWLEALVDAALVLDVDRRITFANSAAEHITGYPRRELIGACCGPLLRARDPHGHPLLVDGWHPSAYLRSTRRLPEHTVTIRSKSGADVNTTMAGNYLRQTGGELAGAVISLRRTARGRLADVRGIEIVSMVSHELRSPLTSVKGYTALLLSRGDRLPDEQKQRMLEQINHDADRVTRLIGELLDISRLEARRLVLRRQLVDLPRLAATVVEKMSLAFPALNCECTFPDDFPKVFLDPDKIEQVLTNLVENACKYASPDGLRIVGAADGHMVSVEVSDHGEGIPATDLPKICSKFFRRATGHPTGSGLGLWISRGLVESHGGELSVTSIVGSGSTFRFTLPQIDLDRLQES